MEGCVAPFIKAKVSRPISREREIELKSRIGKAIELIPGKSEAYLLLEFDDNCRLWLRGRNAEPIAYIEAAIFGNEGHAGYPAFGWKLRCSFSRGDAGFPGGFGHCSGEVLHQIRGYHSICDEEISAAEIIERAKREAGIDVDPFLKEPGQT